MVDRESGILLTTRNVHTQRQEALSDACKLDCTPNRLPAGHGICVIDPVSAQSLALAKSGCQPRNATRASGPLRWALPRKARRRIRPNALGPSRLRRTPFPRQRLMQQHLHVGLVRQPFPIRQFLRGFQVADCDPNRHGLEWVVVRDGHAGALIYSECGGRRWTTRTIPVITSTPGPR